MPEPRLYVTYSVEKDEPEPEFPRWDWIVVIAYICAIIFCAGVFYALAELIVSVT